MIIINVDTQTGKEVFDLSVNNETVWKAIRGCRGFLSVYTCGPSSHPHTRVRPSMLPKFGREDENTDVPLFHLQLFIITRVWACTTKAGVLTDKLKNVRLWDWRLGSHEKGKRGMFGRHRTEICDQGSGCSLHSLPPRMDSIYTPQWADVCRSCFQA